MTPTQFSDLVTVLPIAVAMIFGLVAAAIAGRKRRNTGVWFAVGFLVPLLGVVVIAALEPGPSQERPSFWRPLA
ncbi:MAG TPA: hypothetical protein VGG74_34410 [Kofleriaceae bacterium]|jgi:purine-cytosine permease-like protein